MRLLIDMNLAPSWVPFLESNGVSAIHWSTIGRIDAPDTEVLAWARQNGCAVFTHDLDLSAIVAMTRAHGPSVLQLRLQAVLPSDVGPRVVTVLRECHDALAAGAIVTLDHQATRLRVLPIGAPERPPHDI